MKEELFNSYYVFDFDFNPDSELRVLFSINEEKETVVCYTQGLLKMSVVAKLHPEDTFDENKGKIISLFKLINLLRRKKINALKSLVSAITGNNKREAMFFVDEVVIYNLLIRKISSNAEESYLFEGEYEKYKNGIRILRSCDWNMTSKANDYFKFLRDDELYKEMLNVKNI